MAAKGKFTVTMTHKKDTLGTNVFADDTEGSSIPSLYIKKGSAVGSAKKIKITVEEI